MKYNQNIQEQLLSLNELIFKSQSFQKQQRDEATYHLERIKLTGPVTEVFLEYLIDEQNSWQITAQNKLMAAIKLKNVVKEVYGSTIDYKFYNQKKETTSKSKYHLKHVSLPLSKDDYKKNGAYVKYKNAAMQNPEDEDYISSLMDQDAKDLIHDKIVHSMIHVAKKGDTKLLNMIIEIVSTVSRRYLQRDWPKLFPSLTEYLNDHKQDFDIQKTVFECVKSICKKYRHMLKSNDLLLEKDFVIENFAPTLVDSLVNCEEMGRNQKEGEQNEVQIKMIFAVMNSVLHILESVISQSKKDQAPDYEITLPEFCEVNLTKITECFKFILSVEFDKLQEVPDELMKARAKVIGLIYKFHFAFSKNYYKYEEEMFDSVWNAIETGKIQPTENNQNNLKLVQKTVKYIWDMSLYRSRADFFKTNLKKIFEFLIIPNIYVTEKDKDDYKNDPVAYIQNDLEDPCASDNRSYCLMFVQSLVKKHKNLVRSIVEHYTQIFKDQYDQDKQKNWPAIVCLLDLVSASCITVYSNYNFALDTNVSANDIWGQIHQYVFPDLNDDRDINNLSQLKATQLKFCYRFRNTVDDQYTHNMISMFSEFLQSKNIVNQTYAAACIELYLLKKNFDTNKPVITTENMQDEIIKKTTVDLYNFLFEHPCLYAVRALYRIIQIAKNKIITMGQSEALGNQLQQLIYHVNIDKYIYGPNYVFILFEATALHLKLIIQSQNHDLMKTVQEDLVPVLNQIAKKYNTRLIGYAFQIYALFVDSSKQEEVDKLFREFTDVLVGKQSLWKAAERQLMPAQGQFVIAMILKYPQFMQQWQKELYWIMKYCLSPNIRQETIALQIASTYFEKMDIVDDSLLKDFMLEIFISLNFYRNHTKNKTIPVSIMVQVHIFIATFMITHGPQKLIRICDSIQPGILSMILKAEGNKIKMCQNPPRDRKYVIKAYTDLIVEYPHLFEDDSIKILISSLIQLCSERFLKSCFQVASTIQTSAEDMLVESAINQTYAFQRQRHVQIQSAKVDPKDILHKIDEPEHYFMEQIQKFTETQKKSIEFYMCSDQGTSQNLKRLQKHTKIKMIEEEEEEEEKEG